jgi:arginase
MRDILPDGLVCYYPMIGCFLQFREIIYNSRGNLRNNHRRYVPLTFQRTVSFLSVPFDLGAGRKGVDLGPSAIIQAGLVRRLTQLGIDYIQEGEISSPVTTKSSPNLQLKNMDEVVAVNTKLAEHVSGIVEKGNFPLILGGDHSIAIGTLSGLAQHYENLGVIWFDAHSDLNTEETSPSGNINGMSLAIGLGNGHPLLTQIQSDEPKIKPSNVVIIGSRQLDTAEKAYIRSSGVTCFTMHDIDRMGMGQVIEKALGILSSATDGIHLSFDVNCLDPLVAPGTNNPVPGGVSYREAHFALELLHESGLITSAEFVEVNPTSDSDNKTARLAVEFICSLLGQQIL